MFYANRTELAGFAAHMLGVNPWFILFQYGRGLAWIVLAMVIANLYVGRREALTVSLILILCILITSPLLLPNPLMPSAVRLAHIPEMLLSMSIWAVCLSQFVFLPRQTKETETTSSIPG